MPDATADDWTRLNAAIRASRVSEEPKRARFARRINVNDSTLQILEGARTGNASEDMLDYVTDKLGWERGQWRAILAGYDDETDDAPIRVMPRSYDDASEVGTAFRAGRSVLLDLTQTDLTTAKRFIDFAAGLSFGLRGRIERLAGRVFIVHAQDQGDDLSLALGKIELAWPSAPVAVEDVALIGAAPHGLFKIANDDDVAEAAIEEGSFGGTPPGQSEESDT